MCMAVFIAADEPLPFIDWDESQPAFHVQPISPEEEGVRARLLKPHIYFLGAHTGCSCGFAYGMRDVNTGEDQADELASQASVSALRAYVHRAVDQHGEVEMFSAWESDLELEPEATIEITPAYFDGPAFRMPERVHIRVTPG